MHDKNPDPYYYPKQHRRPQDGSPSPNTRPKIQRKPFWKHPLYLAIWEWLPNGLQIRLLEYEARLEQRQRRPR